MLGARIYGSEVGANICGTELGAMYSGVEVPATSPPPRMPCMARHLRAKIYGAKTCYLGAMSPGTDPQDPKMSLRHLGGQT